MPEQSGHDSSTLADILQRRRRRTIRNVVLVVVLLAAAAALWWWLGAPGLPSNALEPAPAEAPLARRAPPPPEPAPAATPAPPPTPPTPAPPPAPDPIPELDASDALVRELAGTLSSHADVMTWLATDELVRRFVAAVDSVAEGRSPSDRLGSMRPTGRYRVVGDAEQLTADPAAFARYDTLTAVVVGIDTASAVRAYHKLEPLIDEAYRDLGYPDRSFDQALRAAIAELLAAPVVVGEPTLAPRVISHEYTDPELEGLSAAQKQLLRFGPVNAPRIQRKLREVARALGMPESELPLTPLYQVPSTP